MHFAQHVMAVSLVTNFDDVIYSVHKFILIFYNKFGYRTCCTHPSQAIQCASLCVVRAWQFG
jgi:hypothetical protein